MKKNGFAITGFIYTIFVIFLGLMITILALFNNRKNVLDNLKKSVLKDVNEIVSSSDVIYTKTNTIEEFTARTKGYYKFILSSPKIGNTSGSTVTLSLYLVRGETIYILVGSSSYNSGNTEIRSSKDDTNSVIARASYDVSENFVAKEYLDRIIVDTDIKNNNSTTSSVNVSYQSKIRMNDDLNGVQYIKDCVQGNSVNNENNWSEIKVIADGKNIVKNKTLTGNVDNITNVIDGNKSTYATSTESGEQCVVLNLGRTYNIDTISILHKENATYYGSKTYVSNNNKNYKLIRNLELKEESTGLTVSAYEDKQVLQVGSIYVPIKKFGDATWIRVFHHNNLNGTLYWDSLAQVKLDGGYDGLHKQSILYNLDSYKDDNGYFEFLLEYSDIDGYNRWVQTTNPLNSNTTKVLSINKHLSWSRLFKGLILSDSGMSLFYSVKNGSSYYYPIGYVKESENGIEINSNLRTRESTDLWVRIDATDPTCELEATISGVKFKSKEGVYLQTYGINKTGVAEYNEKDNLPLSEGTFYGYVKDRLGHTGSCSITIENPSCELEATTTGIKLNKKGTFLNEYGMNKTGNEEYNGKTDLDVSLGTFYGYVKDKLGNTSKCSLKVEKPNCELSVTEYGVSFKNITGTNVSAYGMNKTGTAEYNNKNNLSLSEGTFYGYVKDKAGNTGECSVIVSNASPRYTKKTKTCERKYNPPKIIRSETKSYTCASHCESCSTSSAPIGYYGTCSSAGTFKRIVSQLINNSDGSVKFNCFENIYTCSSGQYTYGFGKEIITDDASECTPSRITFSCFESTSGKSIVECNKTGSVCPDDTIKVSENYCYKVN